MSTNIDTGNVKQAVREGYGKIIEHLPTGTGPGDYITSLELTARKPAKAKCCG